MNSDMLATIMSAFFGDMPSSTSPALISRSKTALSLSVLDGNGMILSKYPPN